MAETDQTQTPATAHVELPPLPADAVPIVALRQTLAQLAEAGADDAGAAADPLAMNELTVAVTSLPAGVTSHHFAPKLSLPWPLVCPAAESPTK